MSDSELTTLWTQAWDLIESGPVDPGSPARHPVLATQGLSGGGEARMVVLRSADRSLRQLRVHADRASTKCLELRAEPRATLLMWAPHIQMQVRLRVAVQKRQGTYQEWVALPETAQANYGGSPRPGQPISRRHDWAADPDPDRFAVLTCALRGMEVLVLSPAGHNRARFSPADRWHGVWVAP